MAVTIKQIEAFLAVAQLGSFTRAAERLHLAQPALSQQVRDLENGLGVLLFDRTTRRVDLTEAGREFRASSAKVMEDLDLALRHVADLAERKRGRIVVAAPPLLATVVLPAAIAEFQTSHPGIQVAVIDARNEAILSAVRSGQADCGLGTFPPDEDGIERIVLARDSLMLFCGRDSALLGQPNLSWRDLRGEKLIALTRDSGIRLLVEAGFETAELSLKPAYEVAQITTALAFVEAGLGSTVLPAYAWAAANEDKVSALPLVGPSLSRDIVMIRASGRSLAPAVAAFEPVLRRYAQRLMPKREGLRLPELADGAAPR